MPRFDAGDLTPRKRARIVKSTVTPRPIAWISTVSKHGYDNLAPFSSYNYISSNHPVVLFNSPNQSNGGLKDTAQNVLDTSEFAVNIVTKGLLEQMDQTSATIPSDESEFDFASVDRAECHRISPPRVADAVATMECTLYDTLEIHDRLVILGEVQYFHIAEDILTDGKIDMLKIDTVGRLGGVHYTTSSTVDFERRY